MLLDERDRDAIRAAEHLLVLAVHLHVLVLQRHHLVEARIHREPGGGPREEERRQREEDEPEAPPVEDLRRDLEDAILDGHLVCCAGRSSRTPASATRRRLSAAPGSTLEITPRRP